MFWSASLASFWLVAIIDRVYQVKEILILGDHSKPGAGQSAGFEWSPIRCPMRNRQAGPKQGLYVKK
jgi:hypothetical protein